MPHEQFWHRSATGQHLCCIYELIGPDFQYIADVVGPEDNLFPPEIIRKVAKDALEALAYLHAQGMCHGCKSRSVLPTCSHHVVLMLCSLTTVLPCPDISFN